MALITNIIHKSDRDKYWIFVDNNYCCSIRARTFKGMTLSEGQEISCDEIKSMESFHFKNVYNEKSWEKEKVRLDKVKGLIDSFGLGVTVSITGFGANSTEMILEHPNEAGKPDIEIKSNSTSIVVMLIEVTGTEVMRGSDYWVRPDKLKYSQNHPEESVWVILHYSYPREKFVIIQPERDKEYYYTTINIRGTDEHYVIFNDASKEIRKTEEFRQQLELMLN